LTGRAGAPRREGGRPFQGDLAHGEIASGASRRSPVPANPPERSDRTARAWFSVEESAAAYLKKYRSALPPRGSRRDPWGVDDGRSAGLGEKRGSARRKGTPPHPDCGPPGPASRGSYTGGSRLTPGATIDRGLERLDQGHFQRRTRPRSAGGTPTSTPRPYSGACSDLDPRAVSKSRSRKVRGLSPRRSLQQARRGALLRRGRAEGGRRQEADRDCIFCRTILGVTFDGACGGGSLPRRGTLGREGSVRPIGKTISPDVLEMERRPPRSISFRACRQFRKDFLRHSPTVGPGATSPSARPRTTLSGGGEAQRA